MEIKPADMEKYLLDLPQVDCPVSHFFGPGIYIRQVTFLAGTVAIGHKQRYDHLNIFLTGKIAMVEGDKVNVITAPMIFTAPAGQKIGYIIEDTVWLNVYATTETDIETLENKFLEKNDTWTNHDNGVKQIENILCQQDRDDYFKLISEYGYTDDQVRSEAEYEADLIDMPFEFKTAISIRESAIEGKGIFLSYPLKANDLIAPARLNGKRTPLGRYANHAKNPNAYPFMFENGDIYFFARHDIRGCIAGDSGQEITIDYRDALKLKGIEKCLES